MIDDLVGLWCLGVAHGSTCLGLGHAANFSPIPLLPKYVRANVNVFSY